jgi:hypothetical protein
MSLHSLLFEELLRENLSHCQPKHHRQILKFPVDLSEVCPELNIYESYISVRVELNSYTSFFSPSFLYFVNHL